MKSSPTRHIKYIRMDFAPCNKSIMANKLSTNLERFISRIKSPLTLLIEQTIQYSVDITFCEDKGA